MAFTQYHIVAPARKLQLLGNKRSGERTEMCYMHNEMSWVVTRFRLPKAWAAMELKGTMIGSRPGPPRDKTWIGRTLCAPEMPGRDRTAF